MCQNLRVSTYLRNLCFIVVLAIFAPFVAQAELGPAQGGVYFVDHAVLEGHNIKNVSAEPNLTVEHQYGAVADSMKVPIAGGALDQTSSKTQASHNRPSRWYERVLELALSMVIILVVVLFAFFYLLKIITSLCRLVRWAHGGFRVRGRSRAIGVNTGNDGSFFDGGGSSGGGGASDSW